MEDTIKSIELIPVFVPFREGVLDTMRSSEGQHGMAIPTDEPWAGGDAVICKMHSAGGHVGLGEVLVWLPESGATPGQIIDVIEHALYKYVIGERPFDIERIWRRMDNNVAQNEIAKGLLDMACHDLIGQISGKPAVEILHGEPAGEVPLAALVPLADVKTMVMLAKAFCKAGFKTIRYKLGRSVQSDEEISRAIREAVGPSVRLRVDYNQAYSPDEAIRAIKAIEPFRIDVAEQPVDKNDVLGMKHVQERVSVPLMAHEGCASIRDYVSLVELGAVKAVGINAERPGGTIPALEMIDHAARRGLGTVIHSQPLGIASAMLAHVAAARHDVLGHDPELFGNVMFDDDLIDPPLRYDKGAIKIPVGPGWGVKVDERALAKYAKGPATVIP
ncbi:MAG: mandelate racemase/muconate lactonizing enzyme family protein [Candidatus Lokiarchaeota archaeon]|nr:mandelate racemase/muconate lactonizing enzyme family protein [Candidatus Lokiarchaeota archaeon]